MNKAFRHIAILSIITWALFTSMRSIGQIGIADPVTGNALINFWGKVVDQDGNPLQDAMVNLTLHYGWAKSATDGGMMKRDIYLKTDQKGSFVLANVEGHGFEIKSIEKTGYELSKKIQHYYAYSWSARIFHPDSNNPVIFVLWDKTRKTPLIDGDKNLGLIPDGRAYALKFARNTIEPATNSDGDFHLRLMRPAGVRRTDRFDWTFLFEGENGNLLQPTTEGYSEMTYCPKEGFTNVYKETHVASDGNWRGVGHRQFYLKMRDGREYGKATITWDTVGAIAGPGTNEAAIRIQYTINRNGNALAQ